MKILVFGAAGFLGQSILRLLNNDETITGITAVIHNHTLPPELNTEKIQEVSLNEFLRKKSSGETYKAAILLVGKNTAQSSETDTRLSIFEVPKKIVDFCKEIGVSHIIFASSISIRLNGSQGYAEYKRQMEKYIANSGVPYTIFRPALIFGYEYQGLLPIYNCIKRFSVVPVFGNGKKLEQPIYVDEASDFFYQASLTPPENKIYEIGGPQAYSYDSLMETIAKSLGKKIALLHIPARPVISFLRFFERFGFNLPVNSEQIMHIDSDLDIDNTAALEKFSVRMMPFEERIRECITANRIHQRQNIEM